MNRKIKHSEIKWIVSNDNAAIGYINYRSAQKPGIQIVRVPGAKNYFFTENGFLFKKEDNTYVSQCSSTLCPDYSYKICYDNGSEEWIDTKKLVAKCFLRPIEGCKFVEMFNITGFPSDYKYDRDKIAYVNRNERIAIMQRKMKMEGGATDEDINEIISRKRSTSLYPMNNQKIYNDRFNAMRRAKETYGIPFDERLKDNDFWKGWASENYYFYPERLELDKDIASIAFEREKGYMIDLLLYVPHDVNMLFRNGFGISRKIKKGKTLFIINQKVYDDYEDAKSAARQHMLDSLDFFIKREESLGYMPERNINTMKKAYEVLNNTDRYYYEKKK